MAMSRVASATKPAAAAMLRPSTAAPNGARWNSVSGGMTLEMSCHNLLPMLVTGGGSGRPSARPRTGSFSVETQSERIIPGMPTARKAACQPTSPSGPATG